MQLFVEPPYENSDRLTREWWPIHLCSTLAHGTDRTLRITPDEGASAVRRHHTLDLSLPTRPRPPALSVLHHRDFLPDVPKQDVVKHGPTSAIGATRSPRHCHSPRCVDQENQIDHLRLGEAHAQIYLDVDQQC